MVLGKLIAPLDQGADDEIDQKYVHIGFNIVVAKGSFHFGNGKDVLHGHEKGQARSLDEIDRHIADGRQGHHPRLRDNDMAIGLKIR